MEVASIPDNIIIDGINSNNNTTDFFHLLNHFFNNSLNNLNTILFGLDHGLVLRSCSRISLLSIWYVSPVSLTVNSSPLVLVLVFRSSLLCFNNNPPSRTGRNRIEPTEPCMNLSILDMAVVVW